MATTAKLVGPLVRVVPAEGEEIWHNGIGKVEMWNMATFLLENDAKLSH